MPGKKKLTLKWKKAACVSGYEMQVSAKKNFKGAKKSSVNKAKVSRVIKKLKSGRTYYVRLRAYRTYTDSGVKKRAYGGWAKVKAKVK